jgi:hypothetical protein
MSNRKVVDMPQLFSVVERALEFRQQDKHTKGLITTPREAGLADLLKAVAWLLDTWKLSDEHPENKEASQSLDFGEDWVVEAFLKFRRGI